jgi:uroporphyrinogen III methyltransferase/synthase
VNPIPETVKPAGSAAPKPAAGRVAFIGAGPGDEGLLTLRAAALLGQADLVVASPEIAGRVRHLVPPVATVTDSAALDDDPRLLVKAAKAGQLVIRLYSGDPMLFGHAATDAAACVKARVPVEIVPGVPAATAVPAYAGIPLTSEGSGDVRIVHAAEVSRLAAGPGSVVILGAESGLGDLASRWMAAG